MKPNFGSQIRAARRALRSREEHPREPQPREPQPREPQPRTARRRGSVVVLVALCMTIFMGVAALTIDQGFHLTRRAQAQKAADAGALAAAYALSQNQGLTQAENNAYDYVARNGYDRNASVPSARATVVVEATLSGNYINAQGTSTPYPANWVRVKVVRPEPRFFGAAFLKLISGVNSTTQLVGAKSIAEYNAFVLMDPNGGGTYGLNDGPATLSVFGPDARYANGDFKSVKTIGDNGNPGAVNPDYVPDRPDDKDEKSGYNFSVTMPNNFKQSKIDIFDPDCHNAGDISDAATGVRVDELRQKWSVNAGGKADATTTRYRLYSDNGTPGNLSDDILVDEASYGDDASTDMKWTSVFNFDRRNYGGQNFRVNVMSTSGSSENGFNIRAGKKDDTDGVPNSGDEGYNEKLGVNQFPTNGTSVLAQGFMPMNFNRNGPATVKLGYVPNTAANRELVITKFDTDVGGQYVDYTCDTLPGQHFQGVLSGNGEFKTDRLPIPNGYTGGTWSATYAAAIQDTSVWSMYWTGGSSGPGNIKLVE